MKRRDFPALLSLLLALILFPASCAVQIVDPIGGDLFVRTPVISPAGGTYTASCQVILSTPTEGAQIYYTLDGSEPSLINGKVFAHGNPILLSTNATLKAFAFRDNYRASAVSSASFLITAQSGSAATPLLHNKLGSDSELSTGVAGPALTKVGSPAFVPAVFGNGLECLASASHALVPSGLLNATRGTFEFWFKPCYDSTNATNGGNFNSFFDTDGATLSDRFYIRWTSPTQARLSFFTNLNVGTSFTFPAFASNDNVHLAVSWDADGISGGTDKIRVYVNGTQVLAYSPEWKSSPAITYLYLGRNQTGWTARATFDNLKIWDVARTNFSDRFSE